MKTNNVVILVTHKQDTDTLRYISHIAKASENVMDFYVLFDCANSKPQFEEKANMKIFEYDSNELYGFFLQITNYYLILW